jgi:predicted DNA-binding transcriptional regulator AlpA
MANPHPKNAHTSSPALWIEQQVDDWIRATIKRQRWVPVMPDKPSFVRKAEVLRRVGLSNVSLWLMEKRGEFPQRLHLEDEMLPMQRRVEVDAAQ